MDTAETLAFREMLIDAAKRDATDLHLTIGSMPMVRIDGALQPLPNQDVMTSLKIEQIVDSVITSQQRVALEENRDLVIIKVFDGKVRAKIHIFYQEGYLTVSLRFLTLTVDTIRELNIPSNIEQLSSLKNGLVIVGGHYGSGRTTLAMALLEHINEHRVEHIMTIETPIEQNLVGMKSIVNQREVGKDVNSVDDALDALEKEDVDVLFVSDLSSQSVMRKVIELSNAGILVITVMDVSSSDKAIEKIISSFPLQEQTYVRELLADALRSVVIQYLIPRIGGGLIPVHEVLMNTSSVRATILSDHLAQLGQIITSSRTDGMMSFDYELAALVRARAVSLEHAREVAHNREVFDSLVKGFFS